MGHQPHRLHKRLGHENAVKRVLVICSEVFNGYSMFSSPSPGNDSRIRGSSSLRPGGYGHPHHGQGVLMAISHTSAALIQTVVFGDGTVPGAFLRQLRAVRDRPQGNMVSSKRFKIAHRP